MFAHIQKAWLIHRMQKGRLKEQTIDETEKKIAKW